MEKVCRLWLIAIAKLRRSAISKLLDLYNSAEAVYNISESEIKSLKFLNDEEKDALCKKELELANKYLEYISKNDTKFITPIDEEFPFALFHIEDPPHGLFCRGKFIDMNENVLIAVVGARKCTQYGHECARIISRNVAKEGAVIVSGMATGIDSAAHEGALEAGMPTIAVLGCGVNIVYPPSNHNLMRRIMETGMVISEYPVNTSASKYTFPDRNRIISGISSGVAVIEAGARSGSLITARCAAEQGKDIYAVPGHINSPSSKGTNELIKDGAHLITCAEDVTFNYSARLEYVKSKFYNKKTAANEYLTNPADNNDIETAIANILTAEPMTIDEISAVTGMDIPQINTALLMMELSGTVMTHPSGKYSKPIE
ncbi:MAG: DNA-processing protein DprA [Clostridia bacterium]|nr:DNA-processing protein DprA [Clostridia bacterium]